MEDWEKCCLGIIVVFALLGAYTYWPQGPSDTYIDYSSYSISGEYADLFINCYANTTKEHDVLGNYNIQVNLTDSNNTTTQYNLTDDGSGPITLNIPCGEYRMSAYYPGNESYKSATFNETIKI